MTLCLQHVSADLDSFDAVMHMQPDNPAALARVAPVVSKHAVHIAWTTTGQDYVCPFDEGCVQNYYSPFFANNNTGIIAMHPVLQSTVEALDGLISQALQVRNRLPPPRVICSALLCPRSDAHPASSLMQAKHCNVSIAKRCCCAALRPGLQVLTSTIFSPSLPPGMQGGYTFVSAEYFVEQKYGSDCAGVVSLFNQCSSYTNTQVLLQPSRKLAFRTDLCTQGSTTASDC